MSVLEVFQDAVEAAGCEKATIVFEHGMWTVTVFTGEQVITEATDSLPNSACLQVRDQLKREDSPQSRTTQALGCFSHS